MKACALSTMGRSRLGEDLCPDRRGLTLFVSVMSQNRHALTFGSSLSPNQVVPRHRFGLSKPRSSRGFFLSKPHALTPQSGVLSHSIVVGIPSPSRFPRRNRRSPEFPPVLWGFFICGPKSGPDRQFPRLTWPGPPRSGRQNPPSSSDYYLTPCRLLRDEQPGEAFCFLMCLRGYSDSLAGMITSHSCGVAAWIHCGGQRPR